MKKILIVKTGSSFPSLVARRGDFEDWVLGGMQVDVNQTKIVDVGNGRRLPTYDQVSGVVITGSHANVTEHQAWSERIAEWLPGAIERGIPTIGICYGHQLLAYAMGGEVGDNPCGLNFGTRDVHLQQAAQGDVLFGAFPNLIRGHVAHTQSVLRLPPHARLLASSARDPHQAFVLGDCAWGVQFHPEFDAQILAEYIQRSKVALRAQGTDPTLLVRNSTDIPYGPQLLRRFAELVKQKSFTKEKSL